MTATRKKSFCLLFLFPVILFSCHPGSGSNNQPASRSQSAAQERTKPPSTYQDTLTIPDVAAVFYYPDSLQLEKIKAVTEKNVFESSMHEYFYQLRNAHQVLKKHWPGILVIEAKNVRYLQFIKKNRQRYTIDLNFKNDAYGLFAFDRVQNPQLIDLTNIESDLGFYFQPAMAKPSSN